VRSSLTIASRRKDESHDDITGQENSDIGGQISSENTERAKISVPEISFVLVSELRRKRTSLCR
jgi:hypothetical protein